MIDAPVAVRVVDEGDVLHLAVLRALLELDAEFLEAVALGLHVVYRDGDVTKAVGYRRGLRQRVCFTSGRWKEGIAGLNSPATRFLVSVCVSLELGVAFGTPLSRKRKSKSVWKD